MNMLTPKNKLRDHAKEMISRKHEKVFWKIRDLDRSYHFFIGDPKEPVKEIFMEYDELLGENPAFENILPLSMKDVLTRLNSEHPEAVGIKTQDGRIEILKKNTSSPGVLITINGQTKDFFSERALSTINFLNFYDDLKEDANVEPESIRQLIEGNQ